MFTITNNFNKIILPCSLPPVMGVGAFLKNTLCLIQDNEAWISYDNGSLDNIEAIEKYEQTAHKMIAQAKEKPVAIAHDLHPDFPSTRFALGCGLEHIAIQHHHAHIAAIMAEHRVTDSVLGLALDGFGLGINNESWGGELLCVNASGFRRIGHFFPLLQPGGDIAARQPWRMGAAVLWALGRGHEIAKRYAKCPNAAVLTTMLERNINSPTTTSAGRLFDAACGLLGIKLIAVFEGEAPTELESMVQEVKVDPAGWTITEKDNVFILSMMPLLAQLAYMKAQEGAELFHGTLIAALADWVIKAAEQTGIKTVALGGGCFFNKVLRKGLCQRMMELGLTPLLNKTLSPGDAAISLGQAYAAALMIGKGKK